MHIAAMCFTINSYYCKMVIHRCTSSKYRIFIYLKDCICKSMLTVVQTNKFFTLFVLFFLLFFYYMHNLYMSHLSLPLPPISDISEGIPSLGWNLGLCTYQHRTLPGHLIISQQALHIFLDYVVNFQYLCYQTKTNIFYNTSKSTADLN